MVSTFVLILFFHVGPVGEGNSNAVASVPNFATEQECVTAGNQSKKLVAGTVKDVEFVCVKQSK